MSNMLKCPNPSCPYVFDPSRVPAGVVLSCPRCAMQFTLGPPAPAAPPAHPALPARAPAPPPIDPDFEELGRAAVEDRDPDRMLPPRGTNKMQVFILAGIAAVLMAGTGLAIFFKLMRRGSDPVPADTLTRLKDLNVGLEAPPTGWTPDDSTRVKVGSPFVMSYRREKPEAYMAFGATEAPRGRSPRPSEMAGELLQPFPKLFVVNPPPNESSLEKKPPVASSWLGESIAPAEPFPNGFQFRAQSPDGLIWMGEAYAVAHRGIAYYWLSWSLESDYPGLRDEFAAFRGKFKILELRKDWKETQSNVIDFKGDKVPYTVSDADEVWTEVPGREFTALKEVEPDLDKRLRINKTPKRDRKALPDEAELNVYLLDGGGDPLPVARKYVENKEAARIKAAGDFTHTFEELTDAEQGDPLPQTVPAAAPAVRLKSTVKEATNSTRLFVVSGIKVADKIVVVECWCEYGKRGVFETRFVQIAKSLR